MATPVEAGCKDPVEAGGVVMVWMLMVSILVLQLVLQQWRFEYSVFLFKRHGDKVTPDPLSPFNKNIIPTRYPSISTTPFCRWKLLLNHRWLGATL